MEVEDPLKEWAASNDVVTAVPHALAALERLAADQPLDWTKVDKGRFLHWCFRFGLLRIANREDIPV